MKTKEKVIWKELELGFGGCSKFRVFQQFITNPKDAFTRYALVKATGLRTPSVSKQLNILIDLGWIMEYHFTPKTYQINLNNRVVNHLLEFVNKISFINKLK
jgi:hypothetical protein